MAIRNNYAAFVQGTAVKKEEPVQRPYVRPVEHKAVKRRPRRKLSLAEVASAMLAIVSFAICAYMMVSYVRLRSELTEMSRSVTAKRSELSSMISHNDAEYNRIMASVDLSEIEAIARGELGMTYASEGQICFYSGETNDYMRRYGN